MIYLVSGTGNEMGGQWLQTILGDAYRVHFLKDVYYGSHIDSTFVALRPGLMLCNPARINDDTLPEILKQWDVIYSPPMENTGQIRCRLSLQEHRQRLDRYEPVQHQSESGRGRSRPDGSDQAPGETGSRRHPPQIATLQDVGRRVPLHHPGHPPSRNAAAILRLNTLLSLCPTTGQGAGEWGHGPRISLRDDYPQAVMAGPDAYIYSSCLRVFLLLTFVAWRRYLWAAEQARHGQQDACPYSLTDVFSDRHLVNVPASGGSPVADRDLQPLRGEKYPDHTALQIPHTGESLTFAELDARAENVAAALSPFLTGPDQVVAVAMATGQLADRGLSPRHSQGRRHRDVPRHPCRMP